MLDLRRIKFIYFFDRKWTTFLSVGLICRQGWQWSWPESTLLIPLRTTFVRVTTFEVSVKGLSSISLTYVLSTHVLKCSCTVQMISLSVRKSATQLEIQDELCNVLGHRVASLTRWDRFKKQWTQSQGTVLKEARTENLESSSRSDCKCYVSQNLWHPGKTFMMNRSKTWWATSPFFLLSLDPFGRSGIPRLTKVWH